MSVALVKPAQPAASDERYTPEWLLKLVREFAPRGEIDLDVCTSRENPTGARQWHTADSAWGDPDECEPGANGLTVTWSIAPDFALQWCNPPYSRGQVILWARKVIAEARVSHAEILMLTQADVSTGWFKLLRENCDQVCLLSKRVGFVSPDGTQLPGAKFGSALWHFGARRARFRLVFKPLGWVIDGPGPQEVGCD